MRQTGCFDRVWIDASDGIAGLRIFAQLLGQRATDLRDLERMRKTIVENMSGAWGGMLCDLRKTPEGRRINDPVLILLCGAAVLTFLNHRLSVSAKITREFDVVVLSHLVALTGSRNLM